MNSTGRLGIGIISAGKVGATLGNALRGQGHAIIGAYAASEDSQERLATLLPGVPALEVTEIVERAELVLLAVPDDELAPLVAGLAKLSAWQAGQIVIHTAGRYGAEVLAPARALGALCLAIHPAMTFTGTSLDIARLRGCPFAVTAPASLQPIGQALVAEIGGEPVIVAEADRTAYHMALSHGANHSVTLISQSLQILEKIGIDNPGEYLRPLMQAAVEEALQSGDALLTGPISRGDTGSVAAHLQALQELSEEDSSCVNTAATYRTLGIATVARAAWRGKISESKAAELLALLTGEAAE